MFSRRALLLGLLAMTASPASAADHPSLAYLKVVAKEMLAAHRQGTVSAFLRVVQRHADIPEISQHALGKYSGNLQSSQRTRYQKGVATYLARYFALTSRDYSIAKYEIGEATVDKSKDVIISSKVFLLTGQTYSVNWKLVWRGGRYKVRDVSVLGFWLTNFQRKDFTDYLAKRNGNINMLITALYG
jgi:phospholipid transport system substrate-binding protein